MNILKFNVSLLVTFLLFNSVLNAVVKNQKDTGLYSSNDKVEILTSDNFNQTIFGSNKPWIVEFYSSWCGFCQRFAPHWKEFAAEVDNWRDIVGIGVLDCANEMNSPVCFDMIVTSYPTLRYFHQNYKHLPGNVGERVPLGDKAVLHKRHLINELIRDQAMGTSKIELNLQPFVGVNISEVFQSAPEIIRYAILIMQDPTDTIGAEVALDFHQLKDAVIIRYFFNNNTKLWNYLGANQLPAMYAIDRSFNLLYLNSFTLDREGFGRTLLQYLVSKQVQVPVDIINHFQQKYTTENNVKNNTGTDDITEEIKKLGDVVLQGDMETTLRYSLRNEVGLRKEITGEKLQALRNFVDVLVHYFPFSANGKILLHKIKDYIDSTDAISGAEISKMIKAAEKPDQNVFSSPREWLACKGSLPHSRGYPCGLWKLFHYMTVNAAKQRYYENPRVILDTMHGYVKNFFSCEDCKNHFLQMAERRKLSSVSNWDEAILWLWAAHNEVNKRLSGDETEDPAYPKIQFPSIERCKPCYNSDNSWNEEQVLVYLKRMYDGQNIQYLGSNQEVLKLKSNETSRSSRSVFLTNNHIIALVSSTYLILYGQKIIQA